MKLLRTLRLDASDTFVFARAAEPGETAVVGSFLWWDDDPARLEGKARAAFRAGFLGIESLGHATLAEVVEADAAAWRAAVDRLAEQLVGRFGAPDLAAARPAAEEEIAAAVELAEGPAVGAVIAMRRSLADGMIREEFRTLARRSLDEARLDPRHWRAFSFFESEEEPGEVVDLIGAAASAAEEPLSKERPAAGAPLPKRFSAAEAAAPVIGASPRGGEKLS